MDQTPIVEDPTPSPIATPSPIQKEQIDAAKVAKEVTLKPAHAQRAGGTRGQITLHVAEEAVCDACQ